MRYGLVTSLLVDVINHFTDSQVWIWGDILCLLLATYVSVFVC